MKVPKGPVIGIDPGGRSTGVVGRNADVLVYAAVVTREGDDEFPTAAYLLEVIDTVLAAIAVIDEKRWPLLAVEGLNRPNWHVGAGGGAAANPVGVMGVAMTLGAVLGRFPKAEIVPPGGRGSAPLGTYPRMLVGGPHNPGWPRSEPKGTGKLRHARSAWDVAGAAHGPGGR